MSHQTWSSEKGARGLRACVKVWPTGALKAAGMRYRMLRGPWENSGNEVRDLYVSSVALQRRLAAIEASVRIASSLPRSG